MITVPATEFSKNFGRYREIVQREPVAVTSHERVTGYFVSSNDYEEFVRIKAMMPKAYAASELSEETIKAIAASKIGVRHKHLNSLTDEKRKAEEQLEVLLLEGLKGEEHPLTREAWRAIREEAVKQMKKVRKTNH